MHSGAWGQDHDMGLAAISGNINLRRLALSLPNLSCDFLTPQDSPGRLGLHSPILMLTIQQG